MTGGSNAVALWGGLLMVIFIYLFDIFLNQYLGRRGRSMRHDREFACSWDH
jgi:hypothetical protein